MFFKKKKKKNWVKKNHVFFLFKINFRNKASDKHVDLRKIENFVRSKCYLEDISKDKRKKANIRKSFMGII